MKGGSSGLDPSSSGPGSASLSGSWVGGKGLPPLGWGEGEGTFASWEGVGLDPLRP